MSDVLSRNPNARRRPAHDPSRVASVLGGAEVFRHPPDSPLEAHDMLERGMPAEALTYLIRSFSSLEISGPLERALGMSLRTLQRKAAGSQKPLNPEQSGRIWKFAEILARTTDVFGSQEAAERWMETPAIGLDQRRPIDLLSTPAGVGLVVDHLIRLDYGVYA
ncbi:antitoxin [Inquilinus limosus]|uniref:Antitoxin n=2 Tax=Inquilinus limosus TaxID=171674 RepID=A0A211ZRS5_9PROT|nr:antitoxin [Inquilinus limosus]